MARADLPTVPPPEPQCLYCGDTELEHGIGICWGKGGQCLCKQYVSRERPLDEEET